MNKNVSSAGNSSNCFTLLLTTLRKNIDLIELCLRFLHNSTEQSELHSDKPGTFIALFKTF